MARTTGHLQLRHKRNLSLLIACTFSVMVGLGLFVTACRLPDEIACTVSGFGIAILVSGLWIGVPGAAVTWAVSTIAVTNVSISLLPKLLLTTVASSIVGVLILLTLRYALTAPQSLLWCALIAGCVAGAIQSLFHYRATCSPHVWIIFSGALWIIGMHLVRTTTAMYAPSTSYACFWFSGTVLLMLVNLVALVQPVHMLRHQAWSVVWLTLAGFAWLLTTGLLTSIK